MNSNDLETPHSLGLCWNIHLLIFNVVGYVHVNGGRSTYKSGGGGGLIGISYTNGYVTGEITAYGGSGVVENGAAGVTYIKAGLTTKKVTFDIVYTCLAL